MIPVAAISLVSSNRPYRWFMAGEMTHGRSAHRQRSTTHERPATIAGTTPIRPVAPCCALPAAAPAASTALAAPHLPPKSP